MRGQERRQDMLRESAILHETGLQERDEPAQHTPVAA